MPETKASTSMFWMKIKIESAIFWLDFSIKNAAKISKFLFSVKSFGPYHSLCMNVF